MKKSGGWSRCGILFLCGILLYPRLSRAQEWHTEPGHPIGKVSTQGDLIVMELDEGTLGKANLFDLVNHTLRFTPDGSRYRVENGALQWDPDFGPELSGAEVTLHQFAFPFSGKSWNSFLVGRTGSISFGKPEDNGEAEVGPHAGGVSIARFDALADAAGTLVNTVPALCVFFKPRMSGPHYVKELPDRAVVTWYVTEPFGNIQDFTWFKTINRFQAVLHRDGSIEMSYKELAAKDAIVGVYPMLSGADEPLATLSVEPHPAAAAHLDVRNLKLSAADGALLKVTFETRGPVLPEGDPGLGGIAYRVFFDAHNPLPTRLDVVHPNVTWTAVGVTPRRRPSRYIAFGPGVSRKVKATGNTITIEGVLPPALRGVEQVAVYAEVSVKGDSGEPVEQLPRHTIRLTGIRSPEVHLSSLTRKDGPYAVVYESFHYLALPKSQDLSCTVIKSLGDKFDFLAYYSDFRIDNQEAGTPSDGPKAGNVTGTGENQHDLESYCSQGRFQWEFVQPVYVGSNQMQEWPPEGAPVGDSHDITFYLHQLAERSPDGKLPPYNYGMSQIAHEMGHRWSAFVSANVNGETIVLGPVHWVRGLQAPVAFPYQRPTEASIMGGGVWQDNFDGTYTQLDDDYYVPATGFSYLDLYLMGLISAAEVPDFFMLKNLAPAGEDANGHPIFKADRTKVTIQDVIAVEGPRLPDVDHSQKQFNTGMVVVVEHGQKPSPELVERVTGIRRRWIDYWETTTGHRASMTANPQ
ncbi:MAG: hypothetical protein WB919_10540 [Candidatus Sulfotelmatobacter sp.]